MRRMPWELLALPALGLARLVPAEGAGLAFRLAAATLVVFLPGALVARALRTPGASGTLAWAGAALFVGLAIAFALHGSLWTALVVLGVIAAVALPLATRRGGRLPGRGGLAALLLGVGFGLALWQVAGHVDGDALFHLARVRKLDDFGSLTLRSVDEFRDGGLHPGYAFPLWHGLLALVARLAAVDPAAVVLHEATVLAPLAFLVVYEAGAALFRSAWAGLAVLAGQVALTGLAAGHGGAYPSLALPGTAAQQLLAPAVLALFFAWLERPSAGALASVAAAELALALVHPTYALFVLIPLAGFAVVRVLLARADLRLGAAALAALAVPAAAVFAWLLPIVRETVSHDPSAAERARALARYGGQLDVFSIDSYRLAPEVFGRRGAVAVAALACVPLAALAARRRWAAFVLGGSLVVLGLTLIPALFTHFADAVSLSQARRLAGFLPFAFAFAGGAAVLARVGGVAALPAALAGGIALQLVYPGDFGLRLEHGGPAAAAWIAAFGGSAALAVAAVGRGWQWNERAGAIAGLGAVLFVLPVAVHGFTRWSPLDQAGADALSPGLVQALRTHVPERAVVWAEPETSYRIAADAPVYIAVAPPTHVADTRANRPYRRYADAARFRRSGDLAIPRRYGARWIVVDRRRSPRLRLHLPRLYSDGRYALYRLSSRS